MGDKDTIKYRRRRKSGEAKALPRSKNSLLPSKEDEIVVRSKEKDVAAAMLAELGIDNHAGKKHKERRKVAKEAESQVAPVKKEQYDQKKSRSLVETSVTGDNMRSRMKEKRKRSPAPMTDASPSEERPIAQAEREKTMGQPAADVDEHALVQDNRGKKNKSRKYVGTVCTTDETVNNDAHNVEGGQQIRKKRRRIKSNIIDPNEDKTLSEQALKALVYTYSQYQNPVEWKFNKARQNWLIRNIWSPASIPDKYMPLLLWYLRNVKGGVRNALIKSCQDRLRTLEGQGNDESVPPTQIEAESTRALFGLSEKDLKAPSESVHETERSRADAILEMLEEQ